MSENGEALNPTNLAFVEGLYEDYLRDRNSVEQLWRDYFDRADGRARLNGRSRLGPTFTPRSIFNPGGGAPTNGAAKSAADDQHTADENIAQGKALTAAVRQDRIDQLVRAYRVRGHMLAQIDPLGRRESDQPELDPAFYGFSEVDLDRPASSRTISGPDFSTLRLIIDRLRNTYCRSIGVQFMHIDDLDVRHWLQDRMETTENRIELSRREQLRILSHLTDATVFEEFIRRKFVNAKSFSLEGSESLVPLLDLAIEGAAEQGINEIVMGMAHRGRLNVLANIIKKSPTQIFREFADMDTAHYLNSRGDVKYHLGHSGEWVASNGRKVHLSLSFNPSHLEYVNPVVLGRLRAKQDRVGDQNFEKGMTILIHGDAAFIGEGVVQETLNLSELAGYRVGGTIHIIVNNQIGFTTSPSDGRSTVYATDVAKMLQSPIFHVNGEDPEAVAQVVKLALDFRRQFKRDVVIDMYGYRRLGHNEADEPSFTQPLLYEAIRQRKSVRDGYLDHLLKLGGVTQEEADGITAARTESLEKQLNAAKGDEYKYTPSLPGAMWQGFAGGPDDAVPEVDTGVPRDRLAKVLDQLTRYPENFSPHPRLEKMFLAKRREMAAGAELLDWAAAEALALGTLATAGARIRLSGQDSLRGTFTQRHAALYDVKTGEPYIALQHLSPNQAPVEILNSPLSEVGVLGFEYGYSLDFPDGLVMWEAQFGDFVNAAQVIVDQFIASAEDKWHRLSGLVLLLPHGFEGQGPEHSSARLERFLSMCAGDNMQVAYPSTPAQYFHLLRRQVIRKWRKPLIVMTPKGMLRKQISALDDLAQGRFQRIIGDSAVDPKGVTRILMCTGKVYYELADARETRKRTDVAIIRVEQLYPLRAQHFESALAPFSANAPIYWVQEEPENMGAWRHIRNLLGQRILNRFPLHGVYRRAAASPATGSHSTHQLEQKQLIEAAFAGE